MYGSQKTMDILKGVATKTKSPAIKDMLKNEDYDAACCAARQLLDEAMEEHRDGNMTWEAAVKDLSANLKAIDMPDAPDKGEGEAVPVKG